MTASTDCPAVGLVTIWYQSAADIDRFVAQLRADGYPNIQPVFVIHALSPDDLARLRSAVPEAAIVEPGANLGPAAGWNLAISRLLEDEEPNEFIGIRNVDTHFDPRCLARLVAVMQTTPSIGACQPLLCDAEEPQRVLMYGGSLNMRTGQATHDFRGAHFSKSLPATRDADYLDGGSMLIRASVLRTIGGFDERLFMYAEDCDLSLRIRAAGYRTVAIRDARAWHARPEGNRQLPTPHEVFYRTRNRFYLVRKHAGRPRWRALVVRALCWDLARGGSSYLRRGRGDLARAHAEGIFSGISGGFGKRGWVE